MLTVIDHWLRQNFLLETHIYTMRLPEQVPNGVRVQELPESATKRYRYRLVTSKPRITDKLVKNLKESGLLFTTQVVELNTWFRPIIAPKGKSFVFNVFWLFSFIFVILGSVRLVNKMRANEEFMAQMKEAIGILTEADGEKGKKAEAMADAAESLEN